MADLDEVIDRNGFPVLKLKPDAAIRLAHPAGAAPAPAKLPAVEGRRILDLRQVSQILAVDLDSASVIVAKMGTPRCVGWSAPDVIELAKAIKQDAGLRRELGIERVKSE